MEQRETGFIGDKDIVVEGRCDVYWRQTMLCCGRQM